MIDYDHRTICQYQTPKTNGYMLVLNHIKSTQLGEYNSGGLICLGLSINNLELWTVQALAEKSLDRENLVNAD